MPVEISHTLMDARYQKNGGKKDIREADVDYLKQCRGTALYADERFGWRIVPRSKGSSPRKLLKQP